MRGADLWAQQPVSSGPVLSSPEAAARQRVRRSPDGRSAPSRSSVFSVQWITDTSSKALAFPPDTSRAPRVTARPNSPSARPSLIARPHALVTSVEPPPGATFGARPLECRAGAGFLPLRNGDDTYLTRALEGLNDIIHVKCYLIVQHLSDPQKTLVAVSTYSSQL